jgi:glycosyltransferase domain-containing protein|tara:strand:- start:83 stop:1132 length:1050 start_codon:yes stop_codon:yes gene_type:complete
MNISIIIPTKNRLIYLKKLVNYYDSENFQGKLIIPDSSDKDNFVETKFFLNKKKNLNINHFFFEGNEVAARENVCHQLTTKYVAQSGDDDYYCVNGLKKIIEFLDFNKDYSSVSGYGYIVEYDVKKNAVKGASKYNSLHSEKDLPLERIKEMVMKGEVSDYCIFRKELYQKINKFGCYEKDQNKYLLRHYTELGFKLYKFLFGKSRELNLFHLVRFRVPENSIGFLKTIDQIYKEDKKSYFKTYYFFMKKMTLAFKNLNDSDRQKIFLIAKKKIKQIIYKSTFGNTKKFSFLYYLLSRFISLKNIILLGLPYIIFRVFNLKKNKIDLMINENSKIYNNEFKKIINAILN